MLKLFFDRGTLIIKEAEDSSQIPPQFVFDNRVDIWRAPAYMYRPVIEHLLAHKIPHEDHARKYQELTSDSRMSFEPHPYQREAMQAWKTNRFLGIMRISGCLSSCEQGKHSWFLKNVLNHLVVLCSASF